MSDWFRSIAALGLGFAGVAVLTIGLAGVVVPEREATPETAEGTPFPTAVPLHGVGGDLAVTGDREGTLSLRRESQSEAYSLVGDDARVVFEGRPAEVTQISWEGLEFFPDPADCTIIPGELDDRIGVGYAQVGCEDIEDIRGGGTISLAGTLGLPLTMVGESDLPAMGGSVEVGDETWTFDEAFLFEFASQLSGTGTDGYNMVLRDEELASALGFLYDVRTHGLTLARVERDGEAAAQPAGACTLGTRELGRLTPSTGVVELTIDCPAADVPGLGPVPIIGTVIVQQIQFTR